MSKIILIETSTALCSVALAENGAVIYCNGGNLTLTGVVIQNLNLSRTNRVDGGVIYSKYSNFEFDDPSLSLQSYLEYYNSVDLKLASLGNYLETSGSSMVGYAILKGVRLNVLDKKYQSIGLDIFNGICKKYLSVNEDGDLNLGGICLVAGLGSENNLRRYGTVKYYLSEPIVENDAKGVGPLIMAYTEVMKIN